MKLKFDVFKLVTLSYDLQNNNYIPRLLEVSSAVFCKV